MTSVASAARSELDGCWVFHPAAELASAVISFIAYVGLLGWHAGMATFVAVLVHEAGHWLALKYYGIRTKGILFLVVMAATPFEPSKKHNRYQDAMVSLAGPLTGIPLGIIGMALVLMITGSASELGDAYMKMIGEQLSGIWYAIRG